MTKNWLITEKIIAILEVAWGGTILYYSYLVLNNLLHIFLQSANRDDISFFSVAMHYHFGFLIGLLSLFSGAFLLSGKKLGWITSLINTTMMIVMLFIITVFDNSVSSMNDYLFSSLPICLLLFLFILLLSKPFRGKYGSVKSALIWIIIVNVIFIADNFINNIRILNR